MDARIPRHLTTLALFLGLQTCQVADIFGKVPEADRMTVHFHITSVAKEHLRVLLATQNREGGLVAVIFPELELPPDMQSASAEEMTDVESFASRAQAHVASLPRPLLAKWSVGGAERTRFPEEDIYEIDGVAFFLPEDVRARVDGRTLDVKAGVLQFEPALEPYVAEK